MNSKVLAGILLGGAATGAAWAMLTKDKKEALKDTINDKVTAAADFATDYALNALDIIDEQLAEAEDQGQFSGVKAATNKAKQTADHLVDHLTNDEFDKQTADIRAALANSHQDNDDADIVIDATDQQNPTSEK